MLRVSESLPLLQPFSFLLFLSFWMIIRRQQRTKTTEANIDWPSESYNSLQTGIRKLQYGWLTIECWLIVNVIVVDTREQKAEVNMRSRIYIKFEIGAVYVYWKHKCYPENELSEDNWICIDIFVIFMHR